MLQAIECDDAPVAMADDPCDGASWLGAPLFPSKYYRARYYDPKVGRFISADPISPPGMNAYPYVGSNPASSVDPSGLMGVKNNIQEFRLPRPPLGIPACQLSAACSLVTASLTFWCDGNDCTGYRLHTNLLLLGRMFLPSGPPWAPPAVDKTVTNTATARRHEYAWHIDKATEAVRRLVEPVEAMTFSSYDECIARGQLLNSVATSVFNSVLAATREAENAMAGR